MKLRYVVVDTQNSDMVIAAFQHPDSRDRFLSGRPSELGRLELQPAHIADNGDIIRESRRD